MEKLVLRVFLLLLTSIQSFAQLNLCNQTPYPQLCNSLITSKVLVSSPQSSLEVRNIFLNITLDHAQKVHTLISSMDISSFQDLAKFAWEDCLELYEDTIYQLNQTILLSKDFTTIQDIQTYLSAATTNYETCKNGFVDLNISTNLEFFTFTSSKFSQFLTNALAINEAISTTSFKPYTRERGGGGIGGRGGSGGRRLLANGLPSWMLKADHKLLQTSMPTTKADLVVAKDGTGNYKTISEAITAAKNLRSGTKRFIIYVKAGIYKENVVITNKMKNLMLIGDGIDATIVTCNKNVQDGSTTFRSATFGKLRI